jgi:hypothetical protein
MLIKKEQKWDPNIYWTPFSFSLCFYLCLFYLLSVKEDSFHLLFIWSSVSELLDPFPLGWTKSWQNWWSDRSQQRKRSPLTWFACTCILTKSLHFAFLWYDNFCSQIIFRVQSGLAGNLGTPSMLDSLWDNCLTSQWHPWIIPIMTFRKPNKENQILVFSFWMCDCPLHLL